MFSEPLWVTCLVREESLVNCGSVVTQVLLFLQEEKEESPPEAQVNEGNGENLKHCGHCRVLNGSNYTEPRPRPSTHPVRCPHLVPLPLTLPPPSLYRPPRALSGSQRSLATGNLKECCGPADSTTDSWFLYQWNISVSTLQWGREREFETKWKEGKKKIQKKQKQKAKL